MHKQGDLGAGLRERRGQRLEFTAASVNINLGRGPQNQVVLPDYHLSTEHGQIFREDDAYIYKDLRSTNGSRVLRRDGSLVYVDASQGFEVLLHDGDQLLLGDPVEPVVLSCLIAGSAAAQILQPPPRSLSPLERHMLEALRTARHAMGWAQTSAGNRDHRRMLDQAQEAVREAIHAGEAVR